MLHELAGHLHPLHLRQTVACGDLPVESEGPQRVEVNAIQHRLKHARGTVVGLHGIGEDEVAARPQHAGHLGNDPLSPATVENGVLRPHNVEAAVFERNVLEAAVDHLDQMPQPLLRTEGAVAGVLGLAQVERGDRASIGRRQIARGPPVARAYVQNPCIRPRGGQQARHAPYGPARCGGDILVGMIVDADVNVLAAPDVKIEVVGILAVVVPARRLHDVGVCAAHSESSWSA